MPYFPPPSSSGSISTLTGTINAIFGEEGDSVTTSVSNSVITSANLKSFTWVPIETATTSIDDFYLNAINVNISNITDNTSFDIVMSANNNASGTYQINYILTY